MAQQATSNHLAYLDGLRGIAAAWTLLGHASLLSAYYIPVVGAPHYAVDLFMIISGFIMQHQASARQAREPMERPATWLRFYIRRFFRISPVYYAMLFVAIVLGPWLGGWRESIATRFPFADTSMDRYYDQSAANILNHTSYLFGFLPEYHFRTPLPDWSIGLEMQFYLVFPLLFILLQQKAATATLLLVAGAGALWFAIPDYLSAFIEPTFLPLKLNMFLAGMLISLAATRVATTGAKKASAFVLLAIALVVVPLDGKFSLQGLVIRSFCAAILALFALHPSLVPPGVLRRALDAASARLGRGIFFWLGELSYGVYLVHLVVMLPVAGFLATHYGAELRGAWRFALCVTITMLLSYTIAFALLVVIERPGRSLGGQLAGMIGRHRSVQTG